MLQEASGSVPNSIETWHCRLGWKSCLRTRPCPRLWLQWSKPPPPLCTSRRLRMLNRQRLPPSHAPSLQSGPHWHRWGIDPLYVETLIKVGMVACMHACTRKQLPVHGYSLCTLLLDLPKAFLTLCCVLEQAYPPSASSHAQVPKVDQPDISPIRTVPRKPSMKGLSSLKRWFSTTLGTPRGKPQSVRGLCELAGPANKCTCSGQGEPSSGSTS